MELLVGCLEEVKIVSQMMVVFHGDFFPMGFESVKNPPTKNKLKCTKMNKIPTVEVFFLNFLSIELQAYTSAEEKAGSSENWTLGRGDSELGKYHFQVSC